MKKTEINKLTKEQVEDELWRELDTYDQHTLIDLLMSQLNYKEKREWINEFHRDGGDYQ